MHALKSRIPVSPLLLDSLVSERKADGSPHTEKSSASESGDEGHPTCTLLRKEEESGTESESPSESRKRAPSPLKTVRRTPAASIFQQLNSAIEHESPVSFDSPSVLETTVETVSTLPSQAHGFHHPMAQHEDLDGTAQLFSTAVAHRQNLYQTTLEPPVAEIQAKSRASIIEDLHLQLERSSVSQKAVETKVEQLERRLLNAEKEISRLQNLLEVRKRAVLDLTGPITRLLTLHQQETCERSHQDTIPKDVSPIRLNDIMTAISSTCHSPRFSPSLPTQKIYDDRKHPIVKIQDESDSIAVKKAAEAVPKSHRRNSKHASSSATLAPSGSQLLEFQKSLRQIATTKPNIALETESGQVDYERGGDITGWMYKMNTNGKDVSWTKRFCRLSAESFQYYKRASDNKPRLQAPVLYTNTQVALGKYDRKFAFVLITFEEPNDEAGPAPLPELDVSSILPSLSSPALSPSSALTPISLIPSTSMPSVLQTKVKTTVLSVDNEKDLKKWITAFKRAKKLLIDLRSDLRVADSLKEVAELSQTHSIIDHYQEKIDRLLNRPNPCLSARRTTSEQYHGPSSADDGDFKTASQLAAMAASNSYIGNCEFNLALITSELVNTEQDYGRDLETLDRVFRKRLINSRILPEEELSVIFYNLKELIDLNKSLCDLLERTKMKPRHLQDFGQVFISAIQSNSFSVLLDYCAHQKKSVDLLQRRLHSSKQLQQWNEECKNHPDCQKLDVVDFLIKPFQRLCKYSLLLREINILLPKDYADYPKTVEAMELFDKMLQKANEAKRLHESKYRGAELASKLVFSDSLDANMWRSSEVLKKEGTFAQVAVSGPKQKHSVLKLGLLYLFENHLLMCRKEHRGKLHCEQVIPTSQCLVWDSGKNRLNEGFFFSVFFKDIAIEFSCCSPSERDSWILAVNSCLLRELSGDS